MYNSKEQIQDLIRHTEFKLRQFDDEKLKSENTRKVYYRLLIEKAAYKKELETSDTNKFIEFVKKNIRKIKNKKLICDSF